MDWKTGRMRLTFELESDVSSSIDKMKDKPADHCKAMAGEAESDANAYYWRSRGWQRQWGYPKPRAHNFMLRRYGQNLMIAGQMAFLVVPTRPKRKRRRWRRKPSTSVQLRRLSRARMGKAYRTYTVLADPVPTIQRK